MSENKQKLFFPVSLTECFDQNFDFVNDDLPDFGVPSFPSPADSLNFDEFSQNSEKWNNLLSKTFNNCVLPVPLSCDFRCPTRPHIPSSQEKVRMSNANRIAAKTFDVRNTHLYPKNHLKLIEIVNEGKSFEENEAFPETGPRGQTILVNYHINKDTPWYGQLITEKPEPYLYKDYESYKFAMIKWFSYFSQKINFLPHPISMKVTLNTPYIENEENNSVVNFEGPKNTLSKKSENNAKKMFEILIPFSENEKLGEVALSMEQSVRTRGIGGDENLDNSTLQLTDLKMAKYKNLKSLTKCSDFIHDFPDRSEFVKCIKRPRSNSISYKYSLLRQIISILNDNMSSDQILFLNDIETLQNCASIVHFFSPSKRDTYFINNHLTKLSNILPPTQDSQILQHVYKVLLEQNFTHILIVFLEINPNKFKNALKQIKKRYEATKIQMEQIVELGKGVILNWLNSSVSVETASIMIDILFLISEFSSACSTFFAQFGAKLVAFLVRLLKASPKEFKRFQSLVILKRALMQPVFLTVCESFDEMPPNEFLNFPSEFIRFVNILFQYSQPLFSNFQSSIRILSKVVQILPDKDVYENYQTIYQIARYIRRSIQQNDTDMISQSLSMAVSIIDVHPNDASMPVLLDTIKVLATAPGADDFISLCGSNFGFIFDMIQNSPNANIQLHSWKLLSAILSNSRPFISLVSDEGIFRSDFQQILEAPPPFASLGILQFMQFFKTGSKTDNPSEFQTLLEKGSTSLARYIPKYRTKALQLMTDIASRNEEQMTPLNYFLVNTFKKIVERRQKLESENRTEKKKYSATVRVLPGKAKFHF